MLKEIGIKEALQRYLTVDDVKVLIPVVDDPSDWAGCQPAMLSDILNNLIFLVDDADHMIIKEPDEVVFADEPPIETDDTAHETISEEKQIEHAADPQEEEQKEGKEKTVRKRGPKPKGSVDYGKMRTLYETGGWKVPEIAQEMGLSEHFVYKALKEMGVDLTK